MKSKTKSPKRHYYQHDGIPYLLSYCIQQGDTNYEAAAYRIYENEWMSPGSKTGSDFNLLKIDCKRSWDKAVGNVEAGDHKPKKLKEHERLRIAREWVDQRVVYDTFLGQYMCDGVPTNPAAEYDIYNSQADELTFIDKKHFMNAFEVDRMPKVSTLKAWGESLPEWDGKDHIAALCKYIPAKDPVQAELFLKGWLIRCYIQGVNPQELDSNSIVNRWFLILHQEQQDTGKSGFFRWLSPEPEWVKESGLEDNKDGYIALSRYLMILDDELGGLSRVAQHERLKAMISTSKIDVRPPYGRVEIRMVRTASFCGSTNHDGIFPFSEGTSRFLVLPLNETGFNWKGYTKKINKTKLWAQVKALAATSWLEDNNKAITSYRTTTNPDFVKEDIESFVVERYVQAASDTTQVLRAGDIMRILSGTDYGYNNLNINKLGAALKKKFGPRVFGYSVDGVQCRGYRVSLTPADPLPAVTGKTGEPQRPFRAKARRRPQR